VCTGLLQLRVYPFLSISKYTPLCRRHCQGTHLKRTTSWQLWEESIGISKIVMAFVPRISAVARRLRYLYSRRGRASVHANRFCSHPTYSRAFTFNEGSNVPERTRGIRELRVGVGHGRSVEGRATRSHWSWLGILDLDFGLGNGFTTQTGSTFGRSSGSKLTIWTQRRNF
jgi:hypothetical protein